MSYQKTIKVLIADDSAFMRKVLYDIISADPRLEVVATAKNGEEAYQKTKNYLPDVITLDIEMPLMDGLTTLDLIMKECPRPVVMFSALTKAGASATISALEKGAVDFVAKPGGSISLVPEELGKEIINKLLTAAAVPVAKLRAAGEKLAQPATKATETGKKTPNLRDVCSRDKIRLVAVGASTGGPKALHELMSRMPLLPDLAVVIVQHMPPGFTKSLAQRLNSVSKFEVKEAEDGETIETGSAYLAPGAYHMEVCEHKDRLAIRLNQDPPVNGHRPSVEVLLNSVAKIACSKIGIIMTGMGSDGALGMKAMKQAGAVTMGESMETCVVYGMPKAAYNLGAIDYEIPLYSIADTVESVLTNVRRR